MGKYLLVVPSNAKLGRNDDYNDWYDNQHLADVCAVPGITSGRQFEADARSPAPPDAQYLALYEIEADDPAAVVLELQRRAQAGEMQLTDTLDVSSARLMLFKAR